MPPRLGSAVRLDRAYPGQAVLPLSRFCKRVWRTTYQTSYAIPVGYQWGTRTVWSVKPNGMAVALCKCGDRVDIPSREIARGRQGRCLNCENKRRTSVAFVPRRGPLDVPWEDDMDAQHFVRWVKSQDRGGTLEEVANVLDTSVATVFEIERRALGKLRAMYEAGDEEVMALLEAIAMRGEA